MLLHSSSNVVGGTHAHYKRFTDLWVFLLPDELQVLTLLGVVGFV